MSRLTFEALCVVLGAITLAAILFHFPLIPTLPICVVIAASAYWSDRTA